MNYIEEFTPKEIIHVICYPKFPTHTATTNNKTKPNKFSKINGQLIYNDKVNKFTRNNIVKNMQAYLIKNYDWSKIIIEESDYPIGIGIVFKVPVNYGNVGRRANKETGEYYISRKPPEPNYIPNWDVDNYCNIWEKVFNDIIQPTRISPRSKKEIEGVGIIPNDSIDYLHQSGPFRWIPCETLEERELIFIIYKI